MVGESCDVFAIRVLIVQTFAVCVKIQARTHLFVKVHIPFSTRRQRKNFYGLRVKLPLATTILTTEGKGIPATYLQLKEPTSELVYLFLYTIFL